MMSQKSIRALRALVEMAAKGETVRVPDHLMPIWRPFRDISRTRRWADHGPEAISYQEVAAYCAMTRTPLQPHHVEAIMEMDAAWLDHLHQRRNGVTAAVPLPLTAASLDSMLG